MLQNFPGLRNPVFCPVIRFSKNYIFDIYSFQGISGYKNFPGQKGSGFRFLPKSPPYSIFAYWTVSSNVLGCHMLNLLVPDAGIRFFAQLSGFPKTIFLTPTHFKELLGVKIFPDMQCPASGFCLNPFPTTFFAWGTISFTVISIIELTRGLDV